VLDAFMPNFGLIPPSDGAAAGLMKAGTSQLPYVAAWVVPIDNQNSRRTDRDSRLREPDADRLRHHRPARDVP
jgi:hypothetical protein